mmetsp:Transcript_20028/g.43138  ORF Transcript_20028/g.43138 Transcript_20028/m.43138 type:complete len:96 (+) Transcript_20028:33-320(+)
MLLQNRLSVVRSLAEPLYHHNTKEQTMKLLRLATIATASLWGAAAIPFVSSVSVGDKLPSVELHSGFPPQKIDLATYTANKSVVIIGLPGAFTPT